MDGTVTSAPLGSVTGQGTDVSWEPPSPGAFTRALRFGEWISEPVTPLFETWLLTAMEARMHAVLDGWTGQRAPRPFHVVVNGWYFYSINFLSGGAMARSLPTMLAQILREPRRVAGVIPPTVRHSFPLFEREWRDDLLPRYRAAVARADDRVERVPVSELPTLIDELADLAGEYFASVAALAGVAYKLEMNLARAYRRHIARSLGDSHLPLLAGFVAPVAPPSHAVASLDWSAASVPLADAAPSSLDHDRLVTRRETAERDAFRVLASSPRRLRAFQRILADAQHLVPLREAQVSEFTIAWPAMRRAVLRIGEALAQRGVIPESDGVFFLTRDEVLAAVANDDAIAKVDVAARRAERDRSTGLRAPMMVGRLNPVLRRLFDTYPRMVGAVRSDRSLVSGTPTSPGRATGSVRVVRGPQDFDALRPGEILVAPLTAPAWTPLFTRASAVVTDIGSAASHASIIAREYGIPGIVGCGDATTRLRTGMWVTVDGATGNVEPG
jgi:pyruvate,water dikinase